jgi:hypothetical protein
MVGYSVAAGLLAIGAVGLVSGYLPPDPILPVAFLAGQALILLTLTVLLSTRLPPIAGGAIAVVAYGLAWMAGVLGKIGLAIGTTSLVTVSDAVRYLLPTDALWQGVVYGLEPSFVINSVGDEVVARSSPVLRRRRRHRSRSSPGRASGSSSVLALAINQLRRREL